MARRKHEGIFKKAFDVANKIVENDIGVRSWNRLIDDAYDEYYGNEKNKKSPYYHEISRKDFNLNVMQFINELS